METKKYRTIAEVITVLALILVGGVAIDEEKGHYCESRSLAINCDRLSSTAKTCYNSELGNKICREGWKPIKDLLEKEITIDGEVEIIRVKANGGSYICDLENEFIDSYTRCIKQDGNLAYLGELI